VPLKIEGVGSAAALGVVDANHRSASGTPRILEQPESSPAAADPDHAEVNGGMRQRRVALESPPRGWLPGYGCQQAHVAGDFNFGRAVHDDFDGASSVPAGTGYDGLAGYWIRIC